jgi:hypothetical protein
LALSTIPNAGLGVFTTRPLQEGDTVGTPGDVCISILDLKWHMGGRGTDNFFGHSLSMFGMAMPWEWIMNPIFETVSRDSAPEQWIVQPTAI